MQPWRAQRGEKFCNARLGHPFSLISRARSTKNIFRTLNSITRFLPCLARAARRKFLATLHWVTRCLWSLARAARRKNLLLPPSRAQRGEKFCNATLGHPFSLISGARSTKKILTTLNPITRFLSSLARAEKSEEKLAKSIFRYFFAKTRSPRHFFVFM